MWDRRKSKDVLSVRCLNQIFVKLFHGNTTEDGEHNKLHAVNWFDKY